LGGIRPSSTLPVAIDVGTNTESLLNNPFYIGLRRKRATGTEYDELLHEFMSAVKKAYGEKVLVQFEDFANHNAFRLLAKYNTTHLVFNDDIQGTAAVALAGLIAALPLTGGTLADHKFLFFGAGEVCPFPPCCTLKPQPKKMFQCNFFVTTDLQVCFLCQLTQFRVSCNAGWNRYCRDYCIGNQQAGEAYIGRSKEEDLSCGLQGIGDKVPL
jgi:hypothetical protein